MNQTIAVISVREGIIQLGSFDKVQFLIGKVQVCCGMYKF